MRVAILAVQGAFVEHRKKLESLGAECIELRKKEDLKQPFDGLVLPGGESTVQGKLLRELEMYDFLKEKIESLTLEFQLSSGKDGKTFGSISTKNVVEELSKKYDIKVDKRKFINARPIQALGYTNLKIELYKGVIATIKVHLSEK